MLKNNFLQKLTAKWDEGKFVCVGLDQADFEKNKAVIDSTFDLVLAYKPNSAFFEAEGEIGFQSLKKTIQYIREKDPSIPIILDAKRGDIRNTNEAHAKAVFDELGVDAVTVQPLLGKESLKPFLMRKDKGIFVLVKTSNPGAEEFQDLTVTVNGITKPLYRIFAEHIAAWNLFGNLGVVVGATYPNQLAEIREIVGDIPILVPGVGSQGGNDLQAVLKNGLNSKKQGLIISSSRGIIFAPDPRKAAQDLHSKIQDLLKNV